MLGHPLGPGEGPGQGSGAGAEVLPPPGDISSLALSPTHVPTSLRGIPSWPNTSPCWKVPRAVSDPRLNPAPEPAAPKLPSSPVCALAAGDSWQPPASQGTGRDRDISDLPRDATDTTKFPLAGFVSTSAFTSAAAPGLSAAGIFVGLSHPRFRNGWFEPCAPAEATPASCQGTAVSHPDGGNTAWVIEGSVLRAVLLRRWVGVTPGGGKGPRAPGGSWYAGTQKIKISVVNPGPQREPEGIGARLPKPEISRVVLPPRWVWPRWRGAGGTHRRRGVGASVPVPVSPGSRVCGSAPVEPGTCWLG